MIKNLTAKRFFSAAKKNDSLELMIYDSIGKSFWGDSRVSASAIKQMLDDAGDVKKISLRINSPGGDVFEASAIYSLLTQHAAEIETYIDGIAASAAFTVALAGDKVHIAEAAMMMCHNASALVIGTAADMRSTAETLDKVSGQMRDIYAQCSGMKAEDVQKLMDDETFMTAKEAVDYGFADDVVKRSDEEDAAAKAVLASFDLSKLSKKAPRADSRQDTKRVDDEDLKKGAFAYRLDDNHENWKLPIEFSTEEKTKKHIRNAIAQWPKTDMPDAEEKSAARGRIKAAAKAHDIDVADDSLKGIWQQFFADTEDPEANDQCDCDCAECVAGDCENCSDPDCDDPNCEGHEDPAGGTGNEGAEAKAEVERLRLEFEFA